MVIKGSNTVYPVASYGPSLQGLKPGVEISIEGAGSSTGIKALFNGQTDIANSSRWIKPSEIEQMNRDGKYFVPYIVAYDGIASSSTDLLAIDNITLQQLYDIYSGK
jgi:phosphate transport system substrate-binding protein